MNSINMKDEIKNLDTSRKALEKFSVQIGIAGVLIGALLFLAFDIQILGLALIVFGALVFVLRLISLAVLRYVYIGWMATAFFIGTIISTIILIVFFYIVVAPIGFLGRIFGKHFLDRSWDTSKRSWWVVREARGFEKETYEKQF